MFARASAVLVASCVLLPGLVCCGPRPLPPPDPDGLGRVPVAPQGPGPHSPTRFSALRAGQSVPGLLHPERAAAERHQEPPGFRRAGTRRGRRRGARPRRHTGGQAQAAPAGRPARGVAAHARRRTLAAGPPAARPTHPVQVEALGAARGLLGAGAQAHACGSPAPGRSLRRLARSALHYPRLITWAGAPPLRTMRRVATGRLPGFQGRARLGLVAARALPRIQTQNSRSALRTRTWTWSSGAQDEQQ